MEWLLAAAAQSISQGSVSMASLRQRMIEDMQVRNLAVHTQKTYVLQVSMFARHFGKSPEVLGPEEIRTYQVHLTNEKKLATSSILIAISSLRFLYKVTLKKNRAGYGEQTEAINSAAVRIAREVAGDSVLVAGSVSRTQLFEQEGPSPAGHVRDLITEQVRLLAGAGVDFLILETFFHLQEMVIAIECSRASDLPIVATMTFRPTLSQCSDGHSPADCARTMVDAGAAVVGVNCEQEPDRILAIIREMRKAVNVPMAAQPAAFCTTDATPCFTRLLQFPCEMESIQLPRSAFESFGEKAKAEGIQFLGGCCGCNAAYIHAFARGLATANRRCVT
jgi:betaine-homocysteine S-methyltransferase